MQTRLCQGLSHKKMWKQASQYCWQMMHIRIVYQNFDARTDSSGKGLSKGKLWYFQNNK
jgi:hypothetical protein